MEQHSVTCMILSENTVKNNFKTASDRTRIEECILEKVKNAQIEVADATIAKWKGSEMSKVKPIHLKLKKYEQK